MLEASSQPRVYGMPPGADFPAVLADWIKAEYSGHPPEALARVRIIVNTRRMQRRMRALFCDGSARLLPRIGLVTEIEEFLPGALLPAPISHIRRRLELAQLVATRLARDPALGPLAAAVDLADSLADLLDEMQSEGVPPERLNHLDVGEVSEYWHRSLQFLGIARDYVEAVSHLGIDAEARRSLAVDVLCEAWSAHPPTSPVIVAGSTGSRAATSKLMQTVARLPHGCVVLPGFDFDLPPGVWSTLSDDNADDHPQCRFARFLSALDIGFQDVVRGTNPPSPERNRLISLSLRPANVTDQWLDEGPSLGDLRDVTSGLTLVEAPRPRDEALAIGIVIREAVERSDTVALVTPDRTLARRVAAMLSRWRILPDDSGGIPLSLTPPGRYLRHVLRTIADPNGIGEMLALLKHPLTQAGDGRGDHLNFVRALEVFLRQGSYVEITPDILEHFAKDQPKDMGDRAVWLGGVLDKLPHPTECRLSTAIDHHIAVAEALSANGGLWAGTAGQDLKKLVDSIRAEADFRPNLPFSDYARLFENLLSAEGQRESEMVRHDVMIWGTLEARVQGADTVILGGLNDGNWPGQASPDPWLNRRMRRELGLLSPERKIGLSAHDYQQAIGAKRVVLTRSKRTDDGETVPSRWLSRLTNLMDGLPKQHGPTALAQMKIRGDQVLRIAALLDKPDEQIHPQPRPAPAPPVSTRPTEYSVTEIRTLIRDPYAVYARRILRLDALPPLDTVPDARLKGIVFHDVLERYFTPGAEFTDSAAARRRLFDIARAVFLKDVPWPATRSQWLGHLETISDWLFGTEQERRRIARPIATEIKGRMEFAGTPFSIRGKADRIDKMKSGGFVIYDYKTGAAPTAKQVRTFDRQLLIEAIMAETGAFGAVPAGRVDHVAHINVGRSPDMKRVDLVNTGKTDFRTVTVSAELRQLLNAFHDENVGYISRRAMETTRFSGEYDHLARFGEWDASANTEPERMR